MRSWNAGDPQGVNVILLHAASDAGREDIPWLYER